MTRDLLREQHRIEPPTVSPESLDTVRALCHDLRQPLTAIRLLAAAKGGDVQSRLNGILAQAQWLADVVEGVIGDAAGDQPARVDVVDLVSRCVLRAQGTADCEIGLTAAGSTVATAAPVALGRAVSCVLDNAVRAAGPDGHVAVEVTGTAREISVRVIDDGPGLGQVLTENMLGLTITRALVGALGGGFELRPVIAGGLAARIVIPALGSSPAVVSTS